MRVLQAGLALVFLVAVLPLTAVRGADPDQLPKDGRYWVYLGTYTGTTSKGIYVCRFDARTGALTEPELAAATENPSFLTTYPALPGLSSTGGTRLYAANEVGGAGSDGWVSGYAVNRENGALTFLNRQSSRGGLPCHLSVDRTGRSLLVANYGGGNVAALRIGGDGRLGEATAFVQHRGSSLDSQRQQGPHAHWIDVAPGNRLALACDLGLDKVLIYRLDPAKGSLVAGEPASVSLAAGSGPRHLAFAPSGHFAYVINELVNTVTAFSYQAERGALKEIQTVSALPEGFIGRSATAEIAVHPSGKFLYASNRGHDSLAVFAIDAATGRLTVIEHQPTQGKAPRHFAIDPTGQWLLAANQDSDSVVVFRIDATSGRLTTTGQKVGAGRPVCVTFVPMQ